MIGAIYATMTIIFAPISYGMVQVRVSEMLMILPFFTPAAIPGLFIGCIIANIFGGFGLLDVIFGSLATLLSAFLVSKIANKYLAPFPPVIVNAIIIGLVLHVVLDLPLYLTILWISFGQFIACYGLGLPLLLLLEKRKYIFK